MKVRWREHEIILVTIVTAITIGRNLWTIFNLRQEEIESVYAAPFIKNNIPFNFYVNILFPQIAQVLLLYFSYLTIVMFVVPSLRQLSLSDVFLITVRRLGRIISFVFITSYFLALGINAASYYAHPLFYSYGGAGFHILAIFGPNDHPLQNLFTGFDRATIIVAILTVFEYIREVIIRYIEKPDQRRAYRILITNQITSVLVVYFSIAPFILSIAGPNHLLFNIYFALIPSTLLVFLSNIYWLFPLKGEMPIFNFQLMPIFHSKLNKATRFKFRISVTLIRLLLSSFIFVLPFVFVFRHQGEFVNFLLGFWLIEVLIVTPISWLFYQQRKDKIQQLRGVEQELIRSRADLQFLRSQINPHFLFNALNTLYGTALLEKSEHTAEGIQKLGDMMRFMLHQNSLDFIPMRAEIEYLKNYISLQKLRTQSSSDIIIEENIDDNLCNHDIIPMLLIPFVENAFKHGISLSEKSWIKIKLNCDSDHISFEVRNSIHSLQYTDMERGRSGIGLKNVEQRLKLIYPNRYQLHLGVEGAEFIAQLSIQP
jgi:two-component system LytT family sensor kinase